MEKTEAQRKVEELKNKTLVKVVADAGAGPENLSPSVVLPTTKLPKLPTGVSTW